MYDHLSSAQNYVLQFKKIVNAINSYSSIIEKLGDDERDALIFLEDSIMIYNPDDPSDYQDTMNLSAHYSDFILKEFDIGLFKRVLSSVIKTLKTKKIIEDSLKKYAKPGKDILEERFREVKARYMRYLKIICNVFNVEDIKSNLLKSSDYSSQFEGVAISINLYKSVLERLDANDKKALDYLEKCITRANPDDSDDYEITIQTKQNYNLLILEANDISKLKLLLSGIVATLNTKKTIEAALKEYTEIGKNALEQKLQDIETEYKRHLKNICDVSTVDEMKDDLLSDSDYTHQFSIIATSIASYKSVLERLDVDYREALDYLEKCITKSNPDDSNEHKITTQMTRNYDLLMLDANNDISKFKPVLLGIVETLKAKEKAKDVLKEYTESGKDFLEQQLQEIEAEYMKSLKNLCNASSLMVMRASLLRSSSYSFRFDSIVNSIAFDNSILERLGDNDKKALNYLEKCITRSNPDDPDDHEITIQVKRNYDLLMLDANNDIDKFKLVLLGIVETLKAKEKAKDALQWDTKLGKDVLEERFQDAETEYMKHLKSICNVSTIDEMKSKLLNNADHSSQFDSIVKSIAFYNSILERLGDNDKKALNYLEKCITRSKPDDSNEHKITTQMTRNYDLLMLDANNDIDKFKLVLLGIVETLKAKKKAKNALREYTKPGKDILEQRLKDVEAKYKKYLKGICNALYFNEMYNNLLRKTDNSSQFKRILGAIKFYSLSYHNFV
ncbi:BTA121 domain-containing protein surface lipoprotein, partial [Borrelia crocidurae]